MARILRSPSVVVVLSHCRDLGLGSKLMAACLGVSERTVDRWTKGEAEPNPGALRSLEKLESLYEAMARLLKRRAWASWLRSPNKSLSGERPLDLLSRGEVDRVRNVLGMLEWGIYS